jgi:hypothetical protein
MQLVAGDVDRTELEAFIWRREARGRCSDEHLSLALPSYDFSSLLQRETSRVMAEEKAKVKVKIEARVA